MRHLRLFAPARALRRRRRLRQRARRTAGADGRDLPRGGRHPRHRPLPGPAPVLDRTGTSSATPSCSCSTAGTRRRRTGSRRSPVNFGDVTGDVLFANEPRYTGRPEPYCPLDHGFTDTITVSAPFAISRRWPARLVRASRPSTTTRATSCRRSSSASSPSSGDIGGGDIDTADALKPINRATRTTSRTSCRWTWASPADSRHGAPTDPHLPHPSKRATWPTTSPSPSGQSLPLTRPYFYRGRRGSQDFDRTPGRARSAPGGADPSAARRRHRRASSATHRDGSDYAPILTIPQDIAALAPPRATATSRAANNFEARFPHLLLHWWPPAETEAAMARPTQPFHFQLPPAGHASGFPSGRTRSSTRQQQWVPQPIPEGGASRSSGRWWCSEARRSTTTHTVDPASLTAQGNARQPVVIIQGITPASGGDGSAIRRKPRLPLQHGFAAEAFGSPLRRQGGAADRLHAGHLTVVLRPGGHLLQHLFDRTTPTSGRAGHAAPARR